jgi:hypothetical protein
MDIWLEIGIFILGTSLGALLTRIAMVAHVRRIKEEIVQLSPKGA